MSSDEEERARTGGKSNKKRRVGRACDMCRQKKVRCDGEEGRRCTNCITFDDECTYVHSAPKRRTRPKGYVERLEARVSQMEELLNKVCFDLLGEYSTAVEESSKINNDYADSDDDAEGIYHVPSTDLDFSHAIPPSLGAPPPPLPPHARKDSLQAMSPTPAPASFDFSLPQQSRSSSVDAQRGFTDPEALSDSDDELTIRHSLADRLAHILDRSTGLNGESDARPSSPMSTSSYDQDRTGRPSSSAGSPGPSSSRSRPSLSRLEVATMDRRFFGKSSAFTILKTAVNMKNEYWKSAGIVGGGFTVEDAYVSSSPERIHDDCVSSPGATPTDDHADMHTQRPEYSETEILPCGCPQYGPSHPWALPQPGASHVFPHAALLRTLVASYFDIQNTYVPVLHRPTFERAIREGRHRREEDFGNVVLLVCALGSRWCTDRTVLLGVGDDQGRFTAQERSAHAPGNGGGGASTVRPPEMGPESVQDDYWREGEDDEEWHSAGWKWFKQVHFGKKALYAPPSVHSLQALCLASMYLRGSSSPEAARWITGVGLRLAQDMGAHRKKSYRPVPTIEEELMKKAWWSLLWLDWAISPALGRPAGIQHEDFDLDLLVECDDEYWEPTDPHGAAFVQPPGKPAAVTFFNHMLSLNQIQAYALRTIYSTSKSRTILGFTGPQWEERIVTELDSALNNWLDGLPDHLKWDPRNPNTTFLSQSAVLYCAYYSLQITIHRPFIASERGAATTRFPPGSTTPSRFPSLSICTQAARSCVHVSETLCRRLGHGTHASLGVLHHNMIPLFTAGIVLMLNMWAGADAQKQRGQRNTVKEMKEMSDVHRAMDMLKVMEVRWHTAGRLWDMLYELAVVSDLPLPSSSHAAVIRSIKQNRRQMPKSATKNSNETDQRVLRPAPAIGSLGASFQKTVPSQTPRSLDTYRADPVPTWCEYDLTPSVFSQPQATSSTAEAVAPVTDPAFDSVFTSQPRRASQVANKPSGANGHTSKGAVPQRVDAAAMSVNADFGMLFTPRRENNRDIPAQGAFRPTARDRDIPAAHTSKGVGHPPASPADRPPMDTIAQVLDSIQLRNADWAVHQPQDGVLSAPQSLGWTAGTSPPEMNGAAAVPGNVFGMGMGPPGQASSAGASREAVAMWSAAPEDFNWDEWGTYITSIGSNAHGHHPGHHPHLPRHPEHPTNIQIPSSNNPPRAAPPYHTPHDPAFLANI
ncbi:hypothetical protein PHLGIDRAFT_115686 [Phlebiopsis gigantea 11061_1 CR5-6]|uniref:Zn(2)-C6 fungal-type domain-containing protein n=1 Tax=Phlebiopsis gigantea (strain 11061_1 CR5-6) TaxID=745531 RepID=A0A0C3SBQ9_PHLG1|nr:hypothetical protein PHLGIDRAFT_115686 [Phlebiopsis gigantea 11061_1 CR5-6]